MTKTKGAPFTRTETLKLQMKYSPLVLPLFFSPFYCSVELSFDPSVLAFSDHGPLPKLNFCLGMFKVLTPVGCLDLYYLLKHVVKIKYAMFQET